MRRVRDRARKLSLFAAVIVLAYFLGHVAEAANWSETTRYLVQAVIGALFVVVALPIYFAEEIWPQRFKHPRPDLLPRSHR